MIVNHTPFVFSFFMAARAAFIVAALLSFPPSPAHASCSMPAGVGGDIIYNIDHEIMQFCNDTDWVRFPKGAPGCDLPWGGTLPDAGNITAFEAEIVAFGNTCNSENRVCTAEVLSGTFEYQSCVVDGAVDCVLDGQTVADGASATFYSAQVHANCATISLSRTCNAGSLGGSGTFQYASCAPPAVFNLTQIAVGNIHACGVATDSKAYCWGRNSFGALGDNSTSDHSKPALVNNGAGPGTYTQLAAGSYHTCGLGTDGKAYCWGLNTSSQLGDNSTTQRLTPVLVPNGAGPGTYTQLTVGEDYTCGLATNAKAYCWGANYYGMLGDNSTTTRLVPTLVQNGAGSGTYTHLSAASTHMCGVATNSKAYCWGLNTKGELGDNTTTQRIVPVLAQNGTGTGLYTRVATGVSHSCGLATNSKIYCWGSNGDGQLGDNTNTTRNTPVLALNGAGPGAYTRLALGSYNTCAVATDNKIYCWGLNSFGQLGDNTTASHIIPGLVLNGEGPGTYTEVAAKVSQACGIATGGAPYCWGSNTYGQLGDNSTTTRKTPVTVLSP